MLIGMWLRTPMPFVFYLPFLCMLIFEGVPKASVFRKNCISKIHFYVITFLMLFDAPTEPRTFSWSWSTSSPKTLPTHSQGRFKVYRIETHSPNKLFVMSDLETLWNQGLCAAPNISHHIIIWWLAVVLVDLRADLDSIEGDAKIETVPVYLGYTIL